MPKTKFVFVLLPHVHIMDLAGPDQAIHEAIELGADFEIAYCSVENNITTSAGLPIGKTSHYKKIHVQKGDFVIIPGCNVSYLQSGDFAKHRDFLKWIATNHQNGVNICSICAGAFVLAASGVLDSRPCTTHFKRTKQLQEKYPKIDVKENILFTDSNGIYTSAGIASGIDLTLHIIEKLAGSRLAHQVARELVVYNRRSGDDRQQSELLTFRNHIHNGIHKVQDWLIDNIQVKTNLNALAEIANMSERNFTRTFKKETNTTVADYITRIRREKIKQLMKNPDMSVVEIANKVGLKSARQVTRILSGV